MLQPTPSQDPNDPLVQVPQLAKVCSCLDISLVELDSDLEIDELPPDPRRDGPDFHPV